MPQIIPIKELKNTAEIARMCEQSAEPIFVTKNGYGAMVVMSMEAYEKTFAAVKAAELINQSIREVELGAQPVSATAFLTEIGKRYE